MSAIIIRRIPTFLARRATFMTSAINKKEDVLLHDPLEHATGMEKKELLARAAGNEDPFQMNTLKRGVGTKAQPTEVPSILESRIIGCICDEDSVSISWMWLHKGENQRCNCGYWFKLVDGKPL